MNFVAKYLSDLSKIVFGSVVVAQLFAGIDNITLFISALGFQLGSIGLAYTLANEDIK